MPKLVTTRLARLERRRNSGAIAHMLQFSTVATQQNEAAEVATVGFEEDGLETLDVAVALEAPVSIQAPR